jgi:hypothetical protein
MSGGSSPWRGMHSPFGRRRRGRASRSRRAREQQIRRPRPEKRVRESHACANVSAVRSWRRRCSGSDSDGSRVGARRPAAQRRKGGARGQAIGSRTAPLPSRGSTIGRPTCFLSLKLTRGPDVAERPAAVRRWRLRLPATSQWFFPARSRTARRQTGRTSCSTAAFAWRATWHVGSHR